MPKRIFQSSGGGKKGYGGFPVSQFIALSDCPANYTGAGSKFVTVKAGENGLEFTPLPPLAITDTFVVNSQAAMLALTAQTGDVAIRTDINQTFILQGTDPSILAHWVLLLVSPTHAMGGALHTADTLANLKTKISAPDILITSQAAEISTLTAKATPHQTDLLLIEDAEDSSKKKQIKIGDLPENEPITAYTLPYYFGSVASGIIGYFLLQRHPTNAAPAIEDIATVFFPGGSPFYINGFISDFWQKTTIPEGEWVFNLYAKVTNNTANTYFRIDISKRDILGVQTLLFQFDTPIIKNKTKQLIKVRTIQPAYAGLTESDRIVCQVYGITDSAVALDLSLFRDNGPGNYTHFCIPGTLDHITLDAHEIADLTRKLVPVIADNLLIEDSTASVYDKKRILIGDLPAASPGGAAGGDLSGNYPNPTVKQSSVAFAFNGAITPADLAADTNDYNPAGLAGANAIIQDATLDVNITGLAGGSTGRFIIFHNTGASTITLKHNDALSVAANRFDFAGNADYVLIRDASILLWYDSVASKWHNIGGSLNPFPSATFQADQLMLPMATEYPVGQANTPTLARDVTNNSVLILQFDDTANEAIAFDVVVPNEALNINIDFCYRAETAPGAAKIVVPALYWREIKNNTVLAAWSVKQVLTNNLSIPANAYYQYATIKERLLTMGVPRQNTTVQFELIRDAASVTDDLIGDFNLKSLKVWFS